MKPLPMPVRALVVDQERRLTKKGELFWQVILKTRIGLIKAMMWNAPQNVETHPKYPHVEEIIELDSFEDQRLERGNIVINLFHRIAKDDLPPEDVCIVEVEHASEEAINAAETLIGDNSFWDDKEHHKFVINCLCEFDPERLRRCPAATKVHHAYQGGLMIHMAEVLSLCKSYVETVYHRYDFINRDVVYAAAILHDLGKVETYTFNELGIAKQLKSEHMIGHIFYSMFTVNTMAKRAPWLAKFQNSDFIPELLHCIAAHHCTREWGSIVEPQSIEAGIVSRIDYLSSRNGMMEKVLQESLQSGQPIQDEFRIYGEDYFLSSGIKKYIDSRG